MSNLHPSGLPPSLPHGPAWTAPTALAVEAHPGALTHPCTFTIPETASLDAFRHHLNSHGISYSIDPDSVNLVHARKEGLIHFPSLDHMLLAFDRIPFSSYMDPAVTDDIGGGPGPIITPELCVPIPIARDLARIEFPLVPNSADPQASSLTGSELTVKLHNVYKLVQQGVRRLPGPRRTTLLGVLLKSDLISHPDLRAAATAAVLFNHPDAAKSVHAHLVKHDTRTTDTNPPVLVPGTTVCFASTVDSHGHVQQGLHGSVGMSSSSGAAGAQGTHSPPRPSTAPVAQSHSPTPAANRRERLPEASPSPLKKRRIMPTLVQPLPATQGLLHSHHAAEDQEDLSAELTLLESAALRAPPHARFVPSIFGSQGLDPFAPLRHSTLPLVLAFDSRADRSAANWLETAPIVYDVLLRTMLPSHYPRRSAPNVLPTVPPTSVAVIPPMVPPGSPKLASPMTAASVWAQALVSVDQSVYRLALRMYPSGHPENQASVATAAARNQVPLAQTDRVMFLGALSPPSSWRTIAGVYALIPPPPVIVPPTPASADRGRPMSSPHTRSAAPANHPSEPRSALGLLMSPPARVLSPPPQASSSSASFLLKSPPRVTSPAAGGARAVPSTPRHGAPNPHLADPLVLVWEAGIPAKGVAERVPDDVTVYQLVDAPVPSPPSTDALPAFLTSAGGGGDQWVDPGQLRAVARLDVFRIDQLARSITCVQVENACVVVGDDAGGVSVWDMDQLTDPQATHSDDDVPHLEPPTHIELHERVHSIACRQSGSGERVFFIGTRKNLYVWKENTLIPVSKFHDPEGSIVAATVNRRGTHAVLVFPLVVMLVPLGEQAAKMKWEHHLDICAGADAPVQPVKVTFDPNRESLFVIVSGERMQFWDVNDVDNGMFLQHDKPGVADAAFIDSCLLPNHVVTVDWNSDKARHEVVLVRPSEWVLEAVDRNANVSYYSGQLSPPGAGMRRTFRP